MAEPAESVCLVAADRVLVLEGGGPWLVGSGRGADLSFDSGLQARRVRVRRDDDALELTDLDGEPLVLRGLRRARHVARIGDVVTVGRAQLLVASLAVKPATVRWQGMLATSAPALLQLEAIARAAGSRAPVFVAGESGTGKELAARAIHNAGERHARPFVALNCAALPDTLAESELFGVERGAYTGAMRTRAGVFAAASGGTLFLDEIGELSPVVQAKLLRALEIGEVQPVGGARAVRVDVRVVAASWRDLETEAAEGRFRHDLLHRLCVLRVDLVPLRERSADVLPLLHDLLRTHDALDLWPDPLLARRLTEASWPGNVRELRNAVHRAVAAREPTALVPRPPKTIELRAREPAEPQRDEVIASTLTHYRGNRKRAASALGVSRSTLYRWMRGTSPGTG